jgi:hypothetical protein
VTVESSDKDPKKARCHDKGKDSKCIPRISQITTEGVMTVQFPYPIKTFKKDFYPNITKELFADLKTSSLNTTSSITTWEVIDFTP